MKDLYAPPTKEELDSLYAPPTKEELGNVSSMSTGESLARGAAQGATMGFSDELAGALGAVGDVAGDQYALKDLLDRYQAQRDESRRLYAEAEKTNPTAYLSGNLAGGLATGIATGGGTGLANILKIGALGGLGSSEADLTEGQIGQAARDTGTGAAIGALTAGALKLGGMGAKAIGATAPAEDLARGFKLGKQGTDITSKLGQEAAEQQQIGLGKDVIGKINEAIGNAGKTKRDILQTATKDASGDLSGIANKLTASAGDDLASFGRPVKADISKLQELADDFKNAANGKVTAQNLDKMRTAASELTSMGDDALKTKSGQKVAIDTLNSLRDLTRNTVDPSKKQLLIDTDSKLSKLLSSKGLMGLEDNALNQIDEAVQTGKIQDLVSRIEKPSLTGIKTRERLRDISSNLQSVDPELEKLISRNLGDAADISQGLASATNKGKNILSILSTIPSKVGNVAGLSYSKISGIANQPSGFFSQTANSIRNTSGGDKVATSLANVFDKMSQSDSKTRSAMLFGLQQNPQYRQLMKSFVPDMITGDEDERP